MWDLGVLDRPIKVDVAKSKMPLPSKGVDPSFHACPNVFLLDITSQRCNAAIAACSILCSCGNSNSTDPTDTSSHFATTHSLLLKVALRMLAGHHQQGQYQSGTSNAVGPVE